MDESVFQVNLGDFSGPLDLLCHMVESRAIDVAAVKLTDVLSQYVSYMLASRKASLAELAEFFSLATRLLLRKVRALIPGAQEADDGVLFEPGDGDEDALRDDELDEEMLRAMLERFRPYRTAALYLMRHKEERERHFVRISGEEGPPWFDIGDLDGLARHWWGLLGEYSRSREAGTEAHFLMDVPDAVPEEVLVEQRMGEVMGYLSERGEASLHTLLVAFGGEGLIVTLLALLELSRLGRLKLRQEETWGEVEIVAA